RVGCDTAKPSVSAHCLRRREDNGIRELRKAANLTALKLGSNTLTDDAFATLSRLRGVNSLTLVLPGRQITDSSLSSISKIPLLATLDIEALNSSGDRLRQIAILPKLHVLSVDSHLITDADVEGLATARELVILRLKNADITDAGLKHLEKMTRLGVVETP